MTHIIEKLQEEQFELVKLLNCNKLEDEEYLKGVKVLFNNFIKKVETNFIYFGIEKEYFETIKPAISEVGLSIFYTFSMKEINHESKSIINNLFNTLYQNFSKIITDLLDEKKFYIDALIEAFTDVYIVKFVIKKILTNAKV